MSPDRPQQNPLRALAWMGLALTAFSLVAVAGREAARALAAEAGRTTAAFSDTFEIMFMRSLVGAVVVTILIGMSRPGFRQVAPRNLGLHAARNLVHFGAQFSWFHALSLIPLAQLFALEFTAPLWVAVFAWLLLGERFTGARVAAGFLGFLGILVIVRPGANEIDFGSALALLSAIGFALSMIGTKWLTREHSALTILFHMSWMQLILSGGLVASSFAVPGPEAFGWMVTVGLTSLAAHFALARAFAEADAMVVAPMDFLRLPLIGAIGYLAYGEMIDPLVGIGATLIIAGNAINIWSQRRANRMRVG